MRPKLGFAMLFGLFLGACSSTDEGQDTENLGVAEGTGPELRAALGPPNQDAEPEGQAVGSDPGLGSGADDVGYLGVSSFPPGIVYVDGQSLGLTTPARGIALSPGRHEVSVLYEDGRFSQINRVLIRSDVSTNVFYRVRPAATGLDEPAEPANAP